MKMESIRKLASSAEKLMSSDKAVSWGMGVTFLFLMANSWDRQKDLEALEEEKASLLASNKKIRSSLWSWKQTLYADAQAVSDSESPPLVPLARLRAIYGDLPTLPSQHEDGVKKEDNSPSPKMVI